MSTRHQELTEQINNKIKSLKNEVDSILNGGCLGALKNKLDAIQIDIKGIISLIDNENIKEN